MGISIDEKRVYDASEGPTPVYVVGEFGVARVNTSDDLVGEFGLSHRCTARDATGRGGRVAVATDEDVLVGTATGDDEETTFEALDLGPAVAVGFVGDGSHAAGSEDELLVARENGRVVRGDGESWTELGDLADAREADGNSADARGTDDNSADVRDPDEETPVVHAVDGDLVATDAGVYQATDDGLHHVGLEAVRDVSTASVPLAATASGLYRLGNGWMDELDGDFHAVSAAPADADRGATAGTLGWAHAATEEVLLGHEEGARGKGAYDDGAHDEGDWSEVELPVEGEVVALDHRGGGEHGASSGDESSRTAAYAVTDDGTFLLSVGDGWNYQILGLQGVRAVAAP